MPKELEYRPGAPKLEYNHGRRDFLISTALMVSGGVLTAVGLTIDNKKDEEIRELEERLISNYLNNREDPKAAMQKAQEIKSEFERRNFIRDRLEVLPIFGGFGIAVIGVFRLLKFI